MDNEDTATETVAEIEAATSVGQATLLSQAAEMHVAAVEQQAAETQQEAAQVIEEAAQAIEENEDRYTWMMQAISRMETTQEATAEALAVCLSKVSELAAMVEAMSNTTKTEASPRNVEESPAQLQTETAQLQAEAEQVVIPKRRHRLI